MNTLATFRLHPAELINAIAAAAPSPGQPWTAEAIRDSVTQTVTQAAADTKAANDAWQAGRAGLLTNHYHAYNREAINRLDRTTAEMRTKRENVVAANAQLVADKIAANKALITGLFETAVGIGTAAMDGGVTAPVAMKGAMDIFEGISAALNAP